MLTETSIRYPQAELNVIWVRVRYSTKVNAFLDDPLFFLGRSQLYLDVALLRLERGKVALLFSGELAAQDHLKAAPPGTVVQSATDLRAKEELFRAVLARGADELWLDATVDGPPKVRYPLRRALDYVLSFKRQSACL